jgi:small subunit ribosomal protein S2
MVFAEKNIKAKRPPFVSCLRLLLKYKNLFKDPSLFECEMGRASGCEGNVLHKFHATQLQAPSHSVKHTGCLVPKLRASQITIGGSVLHKLRPPLGIETFNRVTRRSVVVAKFIKFLSRYWLRKLGLRAKEESNSSEEKAVHKTRKKDKEKKEFALQEVGASWPLVASCTPATISLHEFASTQRTSRSAVNHTVPKGQRSYIINIEYSFLTIKRGIQVLWEMHRTGGSILFLNTNPIISSMVRKTAVKLRQGYVNDKWVGGLLTNWLHIKKSRDTFIVVESIRRKTHLLGKNIASNPKYRRLKKIYRGLVNVKKKPTLLVALNAYDNCSALHEAKVSGIPTIGFFGGRERPMEYKENLSDSRMITYPILCNEYSLHLVHYFLKLLVDAPSDVRERGLSAPSVLHKSRRKVV